MKNIYRIKLRNLGFGSSQRGASLLEGIAYLGIAAIVILGAVALLTSAFSGANTNRIYEEVTSIRAGTKKLFMAQSATYGNASLNSALISAKVFPSSLKVDGANNVFNVFNGAVNVQGANANFTISYGALPKDVCINSVAGGGDWVDIAVNGSSVGITPSPDVASNACSQSSNTVVWTAN